jgi:UDP-3-O-[3-hydroxymyristoyl] glucosamine N-acyltransferase
MKLQEIATLLGSRVPKDAADVEIRRISSLQSARGDDISFMVSDKHSAAALQSEAAAILVPRDTAIEGKVCLEVGDPYLAYARVALLFEDRSPEFGSGVHPGAIIDETAEVASTACIGPGTVIGAGCRIGEDTVIDARCVLERGVTIGRECRVHSGATIRRDVVVGDRVILQANAVIGSEGFANARDGARFVRIPCFGTVIIEDDVEIGAGTTIDRGNFEPTIIRRGARLDNLIHIAHNVEIGEDAALAAQVGISGSTKVGNRVLIGGQAGFVGHIRIGDDTFVGAKAGISKSVDPRSKITGYPARDLMKMRRIEAAQQELPAMVKELRRIRAEIKKLQQMSS